ncbi:uncharacterized protein LOC121800858 [Salvia splendens]|uniref:uncharacterized protein LOC121800858 n=1 Tax=Salvia splendens TaxID=180675 RepID=UPI001C252B50|nr:uncharacterized protein LOC121800858 [Salvia splendens]
MLITKAINILLDKRNVKYRFQSFLVLCLYTRLLVVFARSVGQLSCFINASIKGISVLNNAKNITSQPTHCPSALLWADILVSYALFVMQNYLTKVWNISFVNAAGILNIWGGISMILPVFFLFLVDTLLGNRTMLVISSISYSLGIGLVTMSTPPVLAGATGTCKDYKPKCVHRPQK